jgi:hypothetical protein
VNAIPASIPSSNSFWKPLQFNVGPVEASMFRGVGCVPEKDERDILGYVIDVVCNHHTAVSISRLSHDAIWDAANDGEEIPMSATLVAEPAQLTRQASEWGRTLVKSVAAAA